MATETQVYYRKAAFDADFRQLQVIGDAQPSRTWQGTDNRTGQPCVIQRIEIDRVFPSPEVIVEANDAFRAAASAVQQYYGIRVFIPRLLGYCASVNGYYTATECAPGFDMREILRTSPMATKLRAISAAVKGIGYILGRLQSLRAASGTLDPEYLLFFTHTELYPRYLRWDPAAEVVTLLRPTSICQTYIQGDRHPERWFLSLLNTIDLEWRTAIPQAGTAEAQYRASFRTLVDELLSLTGHVRISVIIDHVATWAARCDVGSRGGPASPEPVWEFSPGDLEP